MPKRTDINKILLIGSGPIVIGQACEFDYSGSQAARALVDEGYEVILVNSNPATIMTDPMIADKVYLQELTPSSIKEIVHKENPDAVLPTMGGQTALNLAEELQNEGFWEANDVEVIGVDIDAINITEDRQRFRDLMEEIGIDQGRSRTAKSLLEAKEITQELGGVPIVIRPSFTLGGSGGGIVWTQDEFERKVTRGLEMSPVHQVLIEECLYGWKEYELELLRDKNDNVIIICSIENVDPMGVHTGDSVTVAPSQTLTDKQYQRMRDAAIKMMRSIGTFAGGCNVQFAFEPSTGRMVAIEINPRVSRSSALASKATGYPIAKVAARLSMGYTLDELPNEITGTTSACFEPAIDYVVTKVPRFNFDKFDGVDEELTTQMKAVGEVMAIGRTFPESLQKAWQSLEIGYAGLGADRDDPDRDEVRERLRKSYWDRMLQVRNAFRLGASVEEVADVSQVDPWFLYKIQDLVAIEHEIGEQSVATIEDELLEKAKRHGFSDEQIAFLLQDEDLSEADVRKRRKAIDLTPAYVEVARTLTEWTGLADACTFEQGSVLDMPFADGGFEAIMINCNPETVSTDFDVADKLYFEPVFWERVLDIIEHEDPVGVIVQLGGQTALKIANKLEENNIPILGTDLDAMDKVEDRRRFSEMMKEEDIPFPPYGIAQTVPEAVAIAEEYTGYPVLIRPSYVLGGEGMRIAINKEEVEEYVGRVLDMYPDSEILVDRFIEDGIEVDVDAVYDGDELFVAGIMQHIEPAGVHSGDSTAVLPPYSLSDEAIAKIRQYTEQIADRLDVRGLINVQMVVRESDDKVFVIEANPRASRTMPFIAKATSVPVARVGTMVMLGEKLKRFRDAGELESTLTGYAMKEPVFSWDKFPEVPKELGPEMRSTGEAIAFIDELTDEHFQQPYEMKDLYLSR